MISVSGIFAVTFSVIFAYVADITQEHERSTAYGLVRRFLKIFLMIRQSYILVVPHFKDTTLTMFE